MLFNAAELNNKRMQAREALKILGGATFQYKEKMMDQIISSIIRDKVRVEWDYIGEGINGDYNENDPDDIKLLRFHVSKRNNPDDTWENVDDGSYCTNMPFNTPDDILEQALEIIMDHVFELVVAEQSIKKVCERLSHIDDTLTFPSLNGGVKQFTYLGTYQQDSAQNGKIFHSKN